MFHVYFCIVQVYHIQELFGKGSNTDLAIWLKLKVLGDLTAPPLEPAIRIFQRVNVEDK